MKIFNISKIRMSEIIISIALICNLFLAGNYRIIGFLGFGIIYIMAIFSSLERLWVGTKVQISIVLNMVCLILRLAVSLIFGSIYIGTMYSFFLQMGLYFYLIVLTGAKITVKKVTNISRVYSLVFIVVLVAMYVSGIDSLESSIVFSTQFGIFMLPTACFFALRRSDKKIGVIAFLITILTLYLSKVRAALIAYVGFIATYIVWNKIRNSKKLYNMYFICAIILFAMVPIIYIALADPESVVGYYLNNFTIKYTGTRLFSGRDVLWPYVLDQIKEAPIFGSGIGFSLLQLNNMNLSAHNLFFFLLLQTGVVGLLLFCFMLYCFWNEYIKFDDNQYGRIFGAFLIAVLIQQTFSLGLLSGKMALAIPCWTLIAFGTSRFNEPLNCNNLENNYYD